jgi:hypothetical protein
MYDARALHVCHGHEAIDVSVNVRRIGGIYNVMAGQKNIRRHKKTGTQRDALVRAVGCSPQSYNRESVCRISRTTSSNNLRFVFNLPIGG